MAKPNYQKTLFLLSVANLNQLPSDIGLEVAIIGRSNAGKSSVLNQLTQNKNAARTSKTPGRTQLINLYAIDEQRRIADLPGYGYAKVPLSMKQKWEALIDQYLRNRQSLAGLILVMDSRHPMKDFDRKMLQWANESMLPVHILLNKIDKLSVSQTKSMLKEFGNDLKDYSNELTYQTFSALNGLGLKELREKLDTWFAE